MISTWFAVASPLKVRWDKTRHGPGSPSAWLISCWYIQGHGVHWSPFAAAVHGPLNHHECGCQPSLHWDTLQLPHVVHVGSISAGFEGRVLQRPQGRHDQFGKTTRLPEIWMSACACHIFCKSWLEPHFMSEYLLLEGICSWDSSFLQLVPSRESFFEKLQVDGDAGMEEMETFLKAFRPVLSEIQSFMKTHDLDDPTPVWSPCLGKTVCHKLFMKLAKTAIWQ